MPKDYQTTAALFDHSSGNFVIKEIQFVCGIFNEWDKMDKLILGHGHKDEIDYDFPYYSLNFGLIYKQYWNHDITKLNADF